MGQVFLPALRVSLPVSFDIHLHLHVVLVQSLETFRKAMFFRKSEGIGQKSIFILSTLES
jgi:hypothetical protein